MDREINLINYMPPSLMELAEFKALCATETVACNRMKTAYLNLFSDQFIEDSTENGVSRLEKIMGITPKGTDTLDVRKFRLLARKNENLPYTYPTVNRQLTTLCGADGYSFVVDPVGSIATVRVALTAKGMFDEVGVTLEKQLPMNMVIDLSLLYNQWITLSTKRWSELSTKTWYQVRNEVV